MYGSRYFGDDETPIDPVKTLLEAEHLSNDYNPACVDYNYAGQDRVACAIKQNTPAGTITTTAGFHHAEGDLMHPDCSDFTLSTTAKMVEEETDPVMKKELLKQFVEGVIETTEQLLRRIGEEVASAGFSPLTPEGQMESSARIYERALCFRKPDDLLYGSIYAFIMDPIEGVAFMSGNDFTRNGLSVRLVDPNPVLYDRTHTEPNVLFAIHRTLTGTTPPDTPNLNDIEDGDSGFFRYHWAHPLKPELNTPDYLERTPPETPGTALKESYIEVVDISGGLSPNPVYFVFGSGIYLEEDDMMPGDDMMADDGDDGCAIAAADNTPQSTLFNLFLIASVLFSAVFLRKRV